MNSFIWGGKPDKIKRSTLIQNYEKRGIKMINIENFIMSLKVTWIKKILDSYNNGVLKKKHLKRLERHGSDFFNAILKKKYTHPLHRKSMSDSMEKIK